MHSRDILTVELKMISKRGSNFILLLLAITYATKCWGHIMNEIEWGKLINSDWEILTRKPVLNGTRLTVEFILGL